MFQNIQKPSIISPERKKGYWRGIDPDKQIEAALKNKLSEDRSGIDSNPVYRGLALSTKPQYTAIIAV
jgi:hypothetical protein